MRRAPALSFLLATVFIDMLGLGLIVPIVAAAVLAFANVAYGLVILPESRPGDHTTPLALTSPLGSLSAVLRRPVLGRLAVARFCADIARNVQQALWTFFVAYQLAWG